MADIIYLNVPYLEKDLAKAQGAKFDYRQKKWFIASDMDVDAFGRWLPPTYTAPLTAISNTAEIGEIGQDETLDNTARTTPWTLSALLADIAARVSQNGRVYWVVAEIVDMHRSAKGHVYWDLAERANAATHGMDNLDIARTRSIVFADTYRTIAREFEQETGQPLQAGLKVLVQVECQLHSIYGFSLMVRALNYAFSLGVLQKEIAAIRARLKKEGVWQRNKSLNLPRVLTRIAVLSPENAAGLADFRLMSDPMMAAQLCHFTYYTSLFQGLDAKASILHALHTIATDDAWDAIVIIRGGGALADLQYLNDYDIVRAVLALPAPVLLGVGHQSDRILLDEVAHHSFSTPTAVANFLLRRMHKVAHEAVALGARIRTLAGRAQGTGRTRLNLVQARMLDWRTRHQTRTLRVARLMVALQRLARRPISANTLHLIALQHGVRAGVASSMRAARQRLANTAPRMHMATRLYTLRLSGVLDYHAKAVMRSARYRLNKYRTHLTSIKPARALRAHLHRAEQRLTNQAQLLAAHDPKNVLKKGYTLVRDSHDAPITRKASHQGTTPLTIQWLDGKLAVVPVQNTAENTPPNTPPSAKHSALNNPTHTN